MPEDKTHNNRPLESPLGLPDYVSLHEAAELLKVAPETFFEHTEKMPIHGRVLKLTLTKRPPVRDEVHRLRRELEALQKLEKSRPANEVLPILSDYRRAFLPWKRLLPEEIQRVLDAPQDWVLWNANVDGASRPFEVLLLMRSELSVRGKDLQRALDVAKAPPEAHGEPQGTSEKGRKVSVPDSQDSLEGDSSVGRKPELIRWLGTQRELVLLFHILKDSNLIQYDQIPWSLVSKLFTDRDFKPLKAKSLTDTQHKTSKDFLQKDLEDLKQKLRAKLDKE